MSWPRVVTWIRAVGKVTSLSNQGNCLLQVLQKQEELYLGTRSVNVAERSSGLRKMGQPFKSIVVGSVPLGTTRDLKFVREQL